MSASAPHKASFVIDLATISLLVDKNLVTADELIARIEELYNRMNNAHDPIVLALLEGFIGELRARPGATA